MRQLEPGAIVDRYRIDSVLGEGGMAVVYKAIHETLGSPHAIKVLLTQSDEVRSRLMQEGRTQARLRHPHLVAVTDVITIDESPALVMEYVEGPSLERWMQLNRPSIDEAMNMFRGIVRGVRAAHNAGLVHRDLKPANVLLASTAEGLIPKVTDFGLVKDRSSDDSGPITMGGMAMGTPQYMAPEQIRNASGVDQRADMFALGCILYELLCGFRCFDAPDHYSLYKAIVAGKYVPAESRVPELPRNIFVTLRRLLEPDRDKRIANCDIVLDKLYGSHSSGEVAAVKFDEEQPTPVRDLRRELNPPEFAEEPTVQRLERKVPAARPKWFAHPAVQVGLMALLLVGVASVGVWAGRNQDEAVPVAGSTARLDDVVRPGSKAVAIQPPQLSDSEEEEDEAEEPEARSAPVRPVTSVTPGAVARLVVQSRPRSDVTVNGIVVGRTRWDGEVPAGAVAVQLGDGERNKTWQITLEPDQEARLCWDFRSSEPCEVR